MCRVLVTLLVSSAVVHATLSLTYRDQDGISGGWHIKAGDIMDDLAGDLSDPVVLTGILTFTTAFLSAITCLILLCCYFLRFVNDEIQLSPFTFNFYLIPKYKYTYRVSQKNACLEKWA